MYNARYHEFLRQQQQRSLGMRMPLDDRLIFAGGVTYQATAVPTAIHTSVYDRVTSLSERFGWGRRSVRR